jgi:CrcB protein
VFDPVLFLLIALAGGLGSVIRMIFGLWRGKMPWGVLMANISAGLILGFIQVFSQWGLENPLVTGVLYLGLCGGLSTFSAVAADTGDYLREHEYTKAIANLMANLGLPVVALWLPVMFLVVLVN